MATIPQMKADESTDEMARALGEAGCLVVTDAFDTEVRAAVAQAMRPHLDALPAEWIETDDPDEVVAAKMSAGSVLYWMGGTLHRAGANVSDTWRFGVTLTYSVGWVRQEENPYLSITPETIRNLSPELQALTGREAHDAVGVFDPRVIPV